MELKLAAAKTHKYAVSESGDTLEVTERPKGGISLILADGQGSGRSAKANSRMVVAKCIAMISEGARDGAVARAVHDMLYAARDGKVSAELLIASADTASSTLIISRNTTCPVFICQGDKVFSLEGESTPIGVHQMVKPKIDAFPLEAGLTLVGFSDGIWQAGRMFGESWTERELALLIAREAGNPGKLVKKILTASMERDQGRPRDDMSIFAISVLYGHEPVKIRNLEVSFPL